MSEKTDKKDTQLEEKQASMSVRFMNKVMAQFTKNVGEVSLTNFQKVLAQNYFIAIDGALKQAEEKRQRKSEKNRDNLPIAWGNVNMDDKFARNVVAYARVGLDPAQPNHIHVMPFKNNNLNKYDIVFVEGYRGKEIKSTKYGLGVPDDITVELVHKNDHFKEIKKDKNNPVETYEFGIKNSFDRGEVVGGFYYHEYNSNPSKNKLVVFNLEDILKRKPPYASPEFWGGEKTVWKNGKPAGTEKVDGWYEKMCWKTIYRAAYSDITIDSQKIDEDYLRLKQMEESYAEYEIEQEIEQEANSEVIDADYSMVDEAEEDHQEPETKNTENEQKQPENDKKEAQNEQKPPKNEKTDQQSLGQEEGPGF